MAVDGSGNVYLGGTTSSPNLPGSAGGAIPILPAGNPGAPGDSSFVMKVDALLTRVVWSSYGRSYDIPTALAADSAGEVYLAGLLNGGFVRKFSADGSAILWEATVGTNATSLAIDNQSAVTLTGATQSINFPVHHSTAMCPVQDQPSQITFTGGSVLIRLSAAGDLLQSTFLPTRGTLKSTALSANSTAGSFASVDYSGTSVTVAQIGPDAGGIHATALGCVGSAASPVYSYTPAALSPGEIVSIFGDGLGPAVPSYWTLTPDNHISSSLAGVQVTFDGIPAPMLYVQNSQINAVTPWALAGKTSTQLCVNYAGASSCANASVMPAVPAFFTVLPDYGAAINQDGTLNTPQNPAPAGSTISLFLTGLGPLASAEPDGTITPWPAPSLADSVQVWFPNPDFHVNLPYLGEVLYAGPAPLAVGGLYQVNVRIPNTQPNPISGQPAVPALWVTVTLPDGSNISAARVKIATQ